MRALSAVIFTVIVGTVFSTIITYSDCGSASGTIHSVDLSPCPKQPCAFVRGTTPTITVNFTANANISSATVKVYGIILGVEMPYPMPADACQNMTCPISAGSFVTYSVSTYVKDEYPNIRLVVKWKVLDQNDNVVFCFVLPVRVVGKA